MSGFLYLYFINLTLWLLVEEACFAIPLPRKKNFMFRFFGALAIHCLLGYGLIALAHCIPEELSFLSVLYYGLIFGGTLWILSVTLTAKPKEILFVGTAGYAVQHMTYSLGNIVQDLLFLSTGKTLEANFLSYLFFQYGIYLLTGLVAYVTLVRVHRDRGSLKNADIRMILLSLLVLTISIVLSEIVYVDVARQTIPFVVCRVYAIISCGLGLLMQFDLSLRNRAEAENETLEQLLHLEQQQHKLARETIEIINLKCHDLKYQLAVLETLESPKQRQASINELQNLVMIYDSVVRSGNDTLDLVLTEKSLICQKYQIKLSCMVDGKLLSFLEDADLYSLFGNALDNAVESVLQVEPENRVITLRIMAVNQMILIHMDNYCEVSPVFEDGLPITTKSDRRFHGYGTRSIRYLVKKYGGELQMSGTDHQFNLDILFPLHKHV